MFVILFICLCVIFFMIIWHLIYLQTIEYFYNGQIDHITPNLPRRSNYPVVYQGHGIPLIHEDRPTLPVENTMFMFKNNVCRPDCCSNSPYSCNYGCVCLDSQPLKHIKQNAHISPRS